MSASMTEIGAVGIMRAGMAQMLDIIPSLSSPMNFSKSAAISGVLTNSIGLVAREGTVRI